MKWVKKAWNDSTYNVIYKKTETQNQIFFKLQTRSLAEYFEGLSSSLA